MNAVIKKKMYGILLLNVIGLFDIKNSNIIKSVKYLNFRFIKNFIIKMIRSNYTILSNYNTNKRAKK